MPPTARNVVHLYLGGRDLYAEWLESLKDRKARAIVRKRIWRVREGNLGDHRCVGGGVWELRIDFGPGFRVYYGEDASGDIVLILGGDKQSQDEDIRRARELWQRLSASRR